jgi:Peptidase family S41
MNTEFDGWRNDSNHLEENDWKQAAPIIESKYVHGGLRAYCKGHIQSGIVGSAIDYLRVTTFYDYGDVEGYAAEVQCLQKSLDTIFGGTGNLNGLVIDVRLNHGGDDPLGIEIASRLPRRDISPMPRLRETTLVSRLLCISPNDTPRRSRWLTR